MYLISQQARMRHKDILLWGPCTNRDSWTIDAKKKKKKKYSASSGLPKWNISDAEQLTQSYKAGKAWEMTPWNQMLNK